MSIQHPYRQLDDVTTDLAGGDHVRPVSRYSDLFHSRIQPDSETDPAKRSSLTNIRWPRIVGIFQIINGFLTGILGTMEVFIIPLLEITRDEEPIKIGKTNCYAAGIFAGLMMIITGSTAVRASISQRGSTIQRYVILTLISVVLYSGFTALLIVGYTRGWTAKSSYPNDSYLYEIHIFITASIIMGLLFVVAAFIQYYEAVFFGDIQLCNKCYLFLCACCSKSKPVGETESSSLV